MNLQCATPTTTANNVAAAESQSRGGERRGRAAGDVAPPPPPPHLPLPNPSRSVCTYKKPIKVIMRHSCRHFSHQLTM